MSLFKFTFLVFNSFSKSQKLTKELAWLLNFFNYVMLLSTFNSANFSNLLSRIALRQLISHLDFLV